MGLRTGGNQASCLPCPSEFSFLIFLVPIVFLIITLTLGALGYFCVRRRKRKRSRKWRAPKRSCCPRSQPGSRAWEPWDMCTLDKHLLGLFSQFSPSGVAPNIYSLIPNLQVAGLGHSLWGGVSGWLLPRGLWVSWEQH